MTVPPSILTLLNQKDQLKKQNITLTLRKGVIDECKQRKKDKKGNISSQIEDALIEKWQKEVEISQKPGPETVETVMETKETIPETVETVKNYYSVNTEQSESSKNDENYCSADTEQSENGKTEEKPQASAPVIAAASGYGEE